MRRLERLVAMALFLSTRRRVLARDVAERFDVSLRTVYRDVQALAAAGFPIEGNAGDGYRLPQQSYMRPLALTAVEAEALMDLYSTGIHLWNEWTRMWNGEPELAHAIVAERFALHLTPPTAVDPQTVNTPAAVERWVIAHRANFQRLRFDTHCGPFVDITACVVAGPWFAETSADGSSPPACGMNTIAFRDARIVEYWTIGKAADTIGTWARRLRA